MSIETIELAYGAQPLSLETGRLAKQANASIVASVGGTTMLVAVTMADKPREGLDFFPLMVDYREKYYASGRIPGGFFKRESRPGDMETLRARITDRAIRPLFPDGMRNDVMVYITILSSDNVHPADVAALTATSAALRISNIPFHQSTAAVRVGRVEGQFILNPTYEQIEQGDLDLIIAGTREAINMVEAGANEMSEDSMIAALKFAHEAIVKIINQVESDYVPRAGQPKVQFEAPVLAADLKKKVATLATPICAKLVQSELSKEAFQAGETAMLEQVCAAFAESNPESLGLIREECETVLSKAVRKLIIEDGKRVDGRERTEIRPISCEAPVLSATHGSAVFTRGQTQALGVVTLGTVGDNQLMDTMLGTWQKHFMLHYNFPPYSVGEAKPMRAPGRREIGHGALAERALQPMVPAKEDFPYTIRIVSEILESNGSSSMASVCVGSLALMDAGVPLKKAVAGIAMGLVADDQNRMAVLTDIQGVEDHLGDMDFKVAGTVDGITALQMDIKITGVTFEIMEQALRQARDARLQILETMGKLLPQARPELKDSAPRVTTLHISVEKIGMLIGPGGKTVRGIQERTGAKLDIEDDGTVYVSASDAIKAKAAEEEVLQLTAEVEIGQVYTGKCVRIEDFGAFLEILPGRDGLVHISEMDLGRVNRVEDVCQIGDSLEVKVINVDPAGKIRLSRKAVLVDAGGVPAEPSEDGGRSGGFGGRGGGGGDRDRGGRGGDRGGRSGGFGGRSGGGDRDRGGRGGDRGGHSSREGQGSGGAQPEREAPKGDYGFREKPRSDS